MLLLLDDSNIHSLSPYAIFANWFAAAQASEINDPEAMALACVDAKARISLRMVLLKAYQEKSEFQQAGFVFYSNFESDKGKALSDNPNAALLFHWKSLRRQVRIEGQVTPVSDAEADAYFHSRPRQSRIGAWVSQQSRPLKSRAVLQRQAALAALRYAQGKVPRPPYWSGFRLMPQRLEFWQDGAYRLHDRFVFEKSQAKKQNNWKITRLYP